MYGPEVDNNFNTNKWVYLYYSPPTVENVRFADGTLHTVTTPLNDPATPQNEQNAPNFAAALSAWDQYVGYFQLSRFKFVEATATTPAHLDLASEQQILRVDNNRGACCHVAGDIDFDSNNNLWMVTGDDTPAGGGNSGGFGPFNGSSRTRARRSPSPMRPAARSRSRSTARRRLRSPPSRSTTSRSSPPSRRSRTSTTSP